ncbi:MAG: sugar phosphate isomerase/epimerase [Clostridiaceae bacterium]|nr:sugar phosphate isomerase/epimerase [Clostridiaceae bacterium]
MLITGRTSRLNHKWSFDECVRFFKKVGFDGIEFCFEDYYFNVRPDYAERFFARHARELCDELGMVIGSVGNHMDYVYDDDNFELIKKTIPVMQEYGTDILITATPDLKHFHKYHRREEYTERFEKRLKELLELASGYGVKIAIEPEVHNLITTTKDFLNLCEKMGYDNLVCNFDVGHAFLTDEDMFESIKLLGNKIVHAHVEGMNRGEHTHLLPGDGDMDLPAVIRAMKDVGFNGAMALDIYIYEYDEYAEESVRRLREML